MTIIAICLVLITFAVTGIIPGVNAKGVSPHTVNVPIDPDGSINVKIIGSGVVDVNIDQVGGAPQLGGPLDVNIDEVGGHSTHGTLPVEVER